MRSNVVPAMAEERRDPSFDLTKYHSDLIIRLRPEIDERRKLTAEWHELTTRIKQLKSINLESQDSDDIRDLENRISEIQQRINELSRIIYVN